MEKRSFEESKQYVLKVAKEHDVKFIRMWFTDILGMLKSFAITVEELEGALEEGMGFDGSSIEGFARIDESDMVALPDRDTFQLLPWRPREHHAVARMFCDILRPGGENLNELEIVRSDKDEPEKMEVAKAKGIGIKVLPSRAGLVYELKIPLAGSDESPIAIGTEPGKTVGIGFETGKLDFGAMARRPGGMPGGRMPPIGGGMGRGGIGGMGRMGGRGFEMPEDIKIWATVKLSSGESREPAEVRSLSL